MRWVIGVIVAIAFAGCGTAKTSRLDLTTPGAHTGGSVPAPTSSPNPTPTPVTTATATPERREPVTRTERRVIQGWSDALRRGRVNAAADYFTVPTLVSDSSPGWEYLDTKSKVVAFNRGLSCGARLLRVRRGVDGFVIGTFRLVERRGASCSGVGETAAVAFLIRRGRITQWVQIDPDSSEAGATPTPTPSPTPSSTPTMS